MHDDGRRFIPPHTSRRPAHWQAPTDGDLENLEAGYRRGLLPVHAALLHQPMPGLAPGSPEAKQVGEHLYEMARQEAAVDRYFAGLAAPQAGVLARACIFDPRVEVEDSTPIGEFRCVVNPTVEPVGEELVSMIEACLSTGPIKGWVQRHAQVRLRGFTPGGEPIDEVLRGVGARVVQHEADHLDGILFPERIPDDDLLWASVEQLPQFIQYVRAHRRGETPPWDTHTPRDQWQAIRAGLAVFGALADPYSDSSGKGVAP